MESFGIDNIREELIDIADDIFDHPELPYEEFRSSKMLCDWLEKRGFAVERGIADIDTAFKAVYKQGEGGPVIGLICEYDALPNGHSCGHHMQGPAILGAAYELKNADINEAFTIVIYGTPAEEILTGKPKMIEKGCFKELDVAFQTHGGNYAMAREESLTGVDLNVKFTGKHAHDTASPWDSRSGFDAYILACTGMEFLRGHVHDGTRIITKLFDAIGVKDNKDPASCSCSFSFRTYRMEDKKELEKRMRDIIQGAAMMSGVQVDIEKALDVMGTLKAPLLNKLWLANAEAVGADNIDLDPPKRGGSNDFANITHMLPGTIVRVATVPIGVAGHSEEYLKYGKSEKCHEAMLDAAKIVYLTCRQLIEKPELLAEIQSQFRELKEKYGDKE